MTCADPWFLEQCTPHPKNQLPDVFVIEAEAAALGHYLVCIRLRVCRSAMVQCKLSVHAWVRAT